MQHVVACEKEQKQDCNIFASTALKLNLVVACCGLVAPEAELNAHKRLKLRMSDRGIGASAADQERARSGD